MTQNQGASDASNAFLDQFCKHTVCLHWLDVAREGGDAQNCYVSAFLLSVRNEWFLVTAGHVLRAIDERLEAGRRIVRSNLMDGTASGFAFPPITFILGRTEQWYVYDEDQGIDYALVPLREFFVRQLMAAGVTAVDESSVGSLDVDAGEYYLLGFPQEAVRTTSNRVGDTIHVTTDLGTPLLPIERIKAPPPHMARSWPRFYANVPRCGTSNRRAKGVPDSIVGMSGGPIFALRRTSSTSAQYWLIAVQSCWDPEARVLAANPILPLVRYLSDSRKGESAA